MKKTVLLSVLLSPLFFLSSCRKESSGFKKEYYVEAKIDGTKKVFATDPVAIIEDTAHVLDIVGSTSATSTGRFILSLAEDKPITIGAYLAGDPQRRVVAGYYNPGATDDELVYRAGSYGAEGSSLQIVISELNDKKVSGTFSGVFKDNKEVNPGKIVVTDGKFIVPIE